MRMMNLSEVLSLVNRKVEELLEKYPSLRLVSFKHWRTNSIYRKYHIEATFKLDEPEKLIRHNVKLILPNIGFDIDIDYATDEEILELVETLFLRLDHYVYWILRSLNRDPLVV